MEQAIDVNYESDPAIPERPRTGRRLLVALAGGFFVFDSLVIGSLHRVKEDSIFSWANDGGTLASICALIGVLILLAQIIAIALRSRTRNMGLNELVILAVVASIIRAALAGGDAALALQTAGGVAFFMLLTLIIESQSAVGAKSSLEELVKLTPGKARIIKSDGTEQLVEPSLIRPGDCLQIRPGETVYADGHITKGITSLQEANITGESLPVDKEVGAKVFAGTLNLNGLIEIQVDRAGKDTTIGKVRELILEAERTRLPFVRLIDRYIRYYTPVIMMVAVIVWFGTGFAIDRVAALLVAACPVALILATPSATIAALSAAARLGVLIKNVNDIESMAKIDAFVFDKTGTLTKGELGVVRMSPVEGRESAELLRLAASAEQRSNHPVAAAVRRLAEQARVKLREPAQLHEEPGRGVRAEVSGHQILVGNLAWMNDNGLAESDFPEHDEETRGMGILYVMCDGAAVGWVALEDQLRDDATEVIQHLRDVQVDHIALVSGDRGAVARRVAAELKVDSFRGDCIPSEKVDYVTEAKEKGHRVAFVGDGVNDGPALAAGNIGIAMGAAGSDVAMESATIALLNNRLDRLPFLVGLARRTRMVILQNFVIGGIFVFGGMILSSAGKLPPWAAALIQVVGSMIVVMNSARLVREGEELS